MAYFLLTLLLSTASAEWGITCPDRNATSLEKWRNEWADNYGAEEEVPSFNLNCFDDYDEKPACVQRILDFSSGFPYADRADGPSTFPEAAKKLPAEFLMPGGAENEIYHLPPNIEQIAKQKGWKTVRFITRGSGGFEPSSTNLLLVAMPGKSFTPPVPYDRYAQFTIPQDLDPEHLTPQTAIPAAELQAGDYHQAAMISIEQASPGKPARPYYQMLRSGTSGYQRSTATAGECRACHPNGLRAISPLGYHTEPGMPKLAPAEAAKVREVNGMMSSYGPIDWNLHRGTSGAHGARVIDTTLEGPPIGPIEPLTTNPAATSYKDRFPTRTDEFLKSCGTSAGMIMDSDAVGRRGAYLYSQTNPASIRWDRVRNAMSCTTCHDGKSRAILTRNLNGNALVSKLLTDRSMPMGHGDLTVDERIALYSCLLAEEQKERVAWLKDAPCAKPSPVPPAAPRAIPRARNETRRPCVEDRGPAYSPENWPIIGLLVRQFTPARKCVPVTAQSGASAGAAVAGPAPAPAPNAAGGASAAD